MKVSKTKIKDLKVFTSKVHRDSRGYFKETFKKNTLEKIKSMTLEECEECIEKFKAKKGKGNTSSTSIKGKKKK